MEEFVKKCNDKILECLKIFTDDMYNHLSKKLITTKKDTELFNQLTKVNEEICNLLNDLYIKSVEIDMIDDFENYSKNNQRR